LECILTSNQYTHTFNLVLRQHQIQKGPRSSNSGYRLFLEAFGHLFNRFKDMAAQHVKWDAAFVVSRFAIESI